MKYELSVNLEYAFQDAGETLPERIAAAAAAGFRHVEIFLTKGRNLPAVKQALIDNSVDLITTVADYQTQLVDRDAHEGFCGIFRQAAEDALYLDAATSSLLRAAASHG